MSDHCTGFLLRRSVHCPCYLLPQKLICTLLYFSNKLPQAPKIERKEKYHAERILGETVTEQDIMLRSLHSGLDTLTSLLDRLHNPTSVSICSIGMHPLRQCLRCFRPQAGRIKNLNFNFIANFAAHPNDLCYTGDVPQSVARPPPLLPLRIPDHSFLL
jgi:hypothetical protein